MSCSAEGKYIPDKSEEWQPDRLVDRDVRPLHWNAQGIRHEKIIIDATALGELKGATYATEHVVT